jgi:hypothetical protein
MSKREQLRSRRKGQDSETLNTNTNAEPVHNASIHDHINASAEGNDGPIEEPLLPIAGPSRILDRNESIISNKTQGSDESNVIFSYKEVSKEVEYKDEEPLFEWEEISRDPEITSRRYRRKTNKTTFKISHNFGSFSDLFQIESNIDNLYEEFMKKQLENADSDDLVSVSISHSELTGKPLFIPPRRKHTFDKESLFNVLYEVAQSNNSFLLAGSLSLQVNITEKAKGSGKSNPKPPITHEQMKNNSRCVILINNKNNGCGFHALAVCKAKHELAVNSYEWACIRKNTNSAQTFAAKDLANNCGLPYNKEVSCDDFPKIQAFLFNYQMVVIDGHNKNNRLYIGPNYKKEKLYIELIDSQNGVSHYNSIINIVAYMGQSYYCEHCHKPYSHKYTHSCAFICESCFIFPKCSETLAKINCKNCNIDFSGHACYERHLDGRNNICKNRKKCANCLVIYNRKHDCNSQKCRHCGEQYKFQHHYCFLKNLNIDKLAEEDSHKKIIVSYDIESQQNLISDNTYQHDPDLLISMTTCNDCWNEMESKRSKDYCDICGDFKNIFLGRNCIKDFGDYLYKNLAVKAAANDSFIFAFAHNAKGYDNHFVLNDLFQRNFMGVSVIMNGNKVLKATVGNIKFLDSLLMFQQPLAELPKAFGFDSMVKKGFFPHSFHNKENIDYIGPIPEPKYFGIEYMKKKHLKEFNSWYEQEKNKMVLNNTLYNMKEKLIKYCENDVLILLNCIQVFRKIYKDVTAIDPITRCFTLASMGLEIFKARILPEKTIGVTPIKGYKKHGKFSRIGNCWLDFQQKVLDTEIEREIPIDNYIVDGYIGKSNTVFEYNGCYYHCHHCAFPDKRDQKIIRKDGSVSEKTPNEIFESTSAKKRHMLKRGYNIVEEWDCTLTKRRKEDKLFDEYIESRWKKYSLIDRFGGVSVKDSFFGGRTNNIKFFCDVTNEDNGRILYYDFRSLYPTVLKYNFFPVGHPLVVNEDLEDCDISKFFGFVKCIVEPPKKLRIPVLPARINKKLIFPLCIKCAEMKNQASCEHSDLERQMIGTWTTTELSYALTRGYKLKKIIEVYHYENKTKDLFSEYINLWLKFKQQSDGWPNWVQSEEDKKIYIENFLKNEGVLLTMNEIEKNPALRFIAKLFLNTLWGKMAQRPNLPQTQVCSEYKDYWDVATDPEKIVTGELMINEDCLIVTWEYKDDEMAKQGNTSLAIASFVTSYARTELMKVIDEVEKIPGRLLYMDTDSIIFCHHDGEPMPKTDDYLGCLADEISKDYGPNARCTKFCSLGPKVYAMEIWPENASEPVVPIKAKGITLTDKALSIIKMDEMVRIANSYIKNKSDNRFKEEILMIPQMQINSDKMHVLYTKHFQKTFRAMSEKRRLNGNDTLPYGFVD